MPDYTSEYKARINRVLDYIERNLDGDLSLEHLAGIACFSPFHFHRVFRAIMGEPLGRFIQRLRIEAAARKLAGAPHIPITTIALECGFSDSSAFSRAFREQFGMTPSAWRTICDTPGSKMGTPIGKNTPSYGNHGQESPEFSMYFDNVAKTLTWRIHMNDTSYSISVEEQPEMTVAYIRHVGPYKGDTALFGRLIGALCTWAGPRGLLNQDAKLLALYHDDPEVTDAGKQRLSICLSVPPDTEVNGEIGRMIVAGGTYAVGRFELDANQYEEAWGIMYGRWLPQSGYQPADGPPYEWYRNDPKQHPEGKCIVDICIPVKPL